MIWSGKPYNQHLMLTDNVDFFQNLLLPNASFLPAADIRIKSIFATDERR